MRVLTYGVCVCVYVCVYGHPVALGATETSLPQFL